MAEQEQQAREEALVAAVVDSFGRTPDARLRLLLESLARHCMRSAPRRG